MCAADDAAALGVVDVDGKPMKFAWSSAKAWKEAGLAFSALPPSDDDDSARLEHFQHCLDQASCFRKKLRRRPGKIFPPTHVVGGVGRECVNQVMRNGPKAERGWDFETAPRGKHSDGSFPIENVKPDCSFTIDEVKDDHRNLLNHNVQLVAKRLAELRKRAADAATKSALEKAAAEAASAAEGAQGADATAARAEAGDRAKVVQGGVVGVEDVEISL